MEQVVVIGAGISGLSCAFRLKQLGLNPLVLERIERPGGLIASIHKNGFLFESGPQCPRFPAAAWQLVRELKLENEFVAGPPRPKRYILRDRRLHPAPFSPKGLISTSLVGIRSKFRIFSDVIGSSHPPETEETLAQFVRRKFGAEVLDSLVDPFVSTVFFGDPEKMGMESAFASLVKWEREHGSVARGAIRAARSRAHNGGQRSHLAAQDGARNLHVTDALPSLGTFRSGMAALPERLARELKERIGYGIEIRSIAESTNESGRWRISLSSGEKIETEHLILAVPAYAAAELLSGVRPQLASRLSSIEYGQACAIGLAYSRSQVSHCLDGFGYMAPRREGLRTICSFWNSSLFSGRAPNGKVVMTSFVRNSAADFSDLRTQTVIARVAEENAEVLGISGPPVEQVFWADARALPQYAVGHARQVKEIYDDLRSVPNFHLIGNYLRGRSIGECIEIAEQAARDVHASFEGNQADGSVCRS
jgi:oxygen-dependent protoporphyrinogen oxidase